MPIPAFHFLLLAAGEVLRIEGRVTPQKIQDFLNNDDAFGVRVPLGECRLALRLLCNSGFLRRIGAEKDVYDR